MANMTAPLNRSSVDVVAEGRTLVGLAMPWDKVAMVRDVIGGRPSPSYPEAFAPPSTDKTRQEHDSFPTFVGHDPASEPVGVTRFRRSDAEGGLMYESPMSNTPRANGILELVKDGAMRSVSIQFVPYKAVSRSFVGVPKPVTYRTEVGLRHLALAPTGYGQYDEARVHSVRAEVSPEIVAAIEAADAAVDMAMKCLDPRAEDYDVAQAMPLLQAADIATDAALAALGAVDPDDVDGEDADANTSVGALSSARSVMWWTVAHQRSTARTRARWNLPDLPV